MLTGKSHDIHLDLHKRYGKIVRFGPNAVLVSDPASIAEVYGLGAKFPKVSTTASFLDGESWNKVLRTLIFKGMG